MNLWYTSVPEVLNALKMLDFTAIVGIVVKYQLIVTYRKISKFGVNMVYFMGES